MSQEKSNQDSEVRETIRQGEGLGNEGTICVMHMHNPTVNPDEKQALNRGTGEVNSFFLVPILNMGMMAGAVASILYP